MKTNTLLLLLLGWLTATGSLYAQADFYSMQALGHRYIYNSDYFEETRELQVYVSGVDGTLKSDSLLAIYVLDAQYPPTFNLFCSTFELLHPDVPCVIVGLFNADRQSELTPPFTDSLSVKGYSNPGHAQDMLLSLTEEIMPFIREKYHVGKNRLLVGHSLGGTFVTYALMEHPDLFPYILALSPNYKYSKNSMLDRLRDFTASYEGDQELYIYIAHGHTDKTEEDFKTGIQKACSLLEKNKRIDLHYDTLNIDKHSATLFEGYYRGLLKMTDLLKAIK